MEIFSAIRHSLVVSYSFDCCLKISRFSALAICHISFNNLNPYSILIIKKKIGNILFTFTNFLFTLNKLHNSKTYLSTCFNQKTTLFQKSLFFFHITVSFTKRDQMTTTLESQNSYSRKNTGS